jgi:hypothetical protein
MWPLNIRPYVGASDHDREPFDEWWPRVRHHLAHMPDNAAEHWVHRHFGHSPYAHLPLPQLRFEQCVWSLQQLDDISFGSDWGSIATDLSRLDSPMIRQTPLAQMIVAAGTWPEPIIVLDNPDGVKERGGAVMGRWHLIEGHQRLTYLRCLAHKGTAKPSHDVWIMTIAPVTGETKPAATNKSAHGSLDYIWEKLIGAVQSLEIENSSIQERLSRACLGLTTLHLHDFPPDKHEVWIELMEALERVKDAERGNIVASTEAMGPREASHHARTILDLFEWVCHMRGPDYVDDSSSED